MSCKTFGFSAPNTTSTDGYLRGTHHNYPQLFKTTFAPHGRLRRFLTTSYPAHLRKAYPWGFPANTFTFPMTSFSLRPKPLTEWRKGRTVISYYFSYLLLQIHRGNSPAWYLKKVNFPFPLFGNNSMFISITGWKTYTWPLSMAIWWDPWQIRGSYSAGSQRLILCEHTPWATPYEMGVLVIYKNIITT